MSATVAALETPRTDSEAPAAVVHAKRTSPVALGVGILAAICVVAALYLARAFFVPLLIGMLATYALRPIVDGLKACYIPRAAGAALVLGVLVAGMGWATYSLHADAASMI